MKLRSIFLALFAALALGACDAGDPDPPGGEYRAELRSPNGAEGAAAIELTGPGIESITADAGTLHTQPTGNTTHVVLIRDPSGPIKFRITMAPGQAPPAARVVEVVDGDDRPRASLDGYRVTFGR
jgi:hypothetical protein